MHLYSIDKAAYLPKDSLNEIKKTWSNYIEDLKSNKRLLALVVDSIPVAAYDDYMWSNRYVDSYYLTTTYGAPYEIDEFTDINKRFYFLDSLVLGENTAVFLSKYDRPEHLYINVEIQAIQSEYLDVENPTLEQVRNLFVQHFGDVNRLDYQVILYHDIYNELFVPKSWMVF